MLAPVIHPNAAAPASKLSRACLEKAGALPPDVACGPLRSWSGRVNQFGEGNFLHTFADWMFDALNERGVLGASVVVVLNTLVDRIVPDFPCNEAPQLTREPGCEDALLVAAAWFHLWVIGGPSHLSDELPFHRTGLNVIWTSDLTPYRERKVRILNDAHATGALAAFPGGLNTVRKMMGDATFGACLRRALFDEILPFAPGDEAERATYAKAEVLRSDSLWRRDLDAIPGLTERVTASVSSILNGGVRAAANALVS